MAHKEEAITTQELEKELMPPNRPTKQIPHKY